MVLEQTGQSLNDTVIDQQQPESSLQTLPQRKKPGRKPNPASPALRKAQNRAAQRAFRERKERHLRDLEDTIKAQREKQHESDITHQKELQQLRSMIENLENEKRYWKEVSLTFELALNHIHGNAEITSKIKATLMNSARVLLPTPISMSNGQPVAGLFGFVQDNNRFTLGVDNHRPKALDAPEPLSANLQSPHPAESFLPSPTNSSTALSPLTTPSSLRMSAGSISPPTTTYSFNDDQPNDKTSDTGPNNTTPTITSSYLTEDYLDSLMKNFSSDYGQVFPVYQPSQNQNTEIVSLKHSDPITQQLISLANLVGAQDLSGVEPKIRYPLTTQQMYYLQQPHDPRIDMIPCLHLRSRMIQHRDSYDMYELCDLLIKKAKCHGDDPLDPDAWEMPEEFFEKYNFLSFSQCRIKSTLYRMNPRLPPNDLTDMLKKRASVYLVS